MESENNNSGPSLGEISTIRNILMGNHMQTYDKTFADINARFDENNKDKDERFRALEYQMNKRFEALNQDLNERFDKLEALLADNVQKLNERVETVSVTDKADLGRLLAEVSNRLING